MSLRVLGNTVLVAWVLIVFYILYQNNGQFSADEIQFQNRLQKLEAKTYSEYRKSHMLSNTLLEFLKIKFNATTDEPSYLKPTNSVALSSKQLQKLRGTAFQPRRHVDDGHRLESTVPQIMEKPTLTLMPNGQPVIPILVLACNRTSVSKCLENLIQYRRDVNQFPIIVSQDCGDEPTKKVILSYASQVNFIEQPDQSEPRTIKFKGYYKIARHYSWALSTIFQCDYQFVVIIEDDLIVAPDFYEYFLGTYHLLREDKSIWCISAWNDNGKANTVDAAHPELLYRTDFFPGLGWMLTRELWMELSVKWPKSFWDDWLRLPEQRQNRVCIRPEISRTKSLRGFGVSNGLFFDKHLQFIKLNEDFVDFTKLNLSYLLLENYVKTFFKNVYSSPNVTHDELCRGSISTDGAVRIQYTTKNQFKRIAKELGLMDDFKSGVPRTAYHGIVSFFYNKRRVFLAPKVNWSGYDLSWT